MFLRETQPFTHWCYILSAVFVVFSPLFNIITIMITYLCVFLLVWFWYIWPEDSWKQLQIPSCQLTNFFPLSKTKKITTNPNLLCFSRDKEKHFSQADFEFQGFCEKNANVELWIRSENSTHLEAVPEIFKYSVHWWLLMFSTFFFLLTCFWFGPLLNSA